MDPSPTRRRRARAFGNGLARLAVGAAFAVAVLNYGLLGVEKGIVNGARWVADHSGATRASEIWRATGRPRLDRAATTGYQFLRESAASVLDVLDVSAPANRTFERVGKAAATGSKSLLGKGNATQSGSATEKTP